MPVILSFDPTANSTQGQVIRDATPFNDGVMTAAQAAKLASLFPSGSEGVFLTAISQPADGTDFIVTIPAALVPPSANYVPLPVIMTANTFTGISISFADQTRTTFRVTTDGELPDGTLLAFFIQPF
jgi:hypothetical protein